MKALSLHQPWASLIALGAKSIETRGWSTEYRGPMAIHSTKVKPYGFPETRGWVGSYMVGRWTDEIVHADPCDCDEDEELAGARCIRHSEWSWALLDDGGAFAPTLAAKLPLGAVVATCELVDVVGTEDIRLSSDLEEPYLRVVDRSGADHVDWYLVSRRQVPYGDFGPNRFAWMLDNIRPLAEPVPATGHQRWWEWSGG